MVGTIRVILGTIGATLGTIRAIHGTIRAIHGTIEAMVGTFGVIVGTVGANFGRIGVSLGTKGVFARTFRANMPKYSPKRRTKRTSTGSGGEAKAWTLRSRACQTPTLPKSCILISNE